MPRLHPYSTSHFSSWFYQGSRSLCWRSPTSVSVQCYALKSPQLILHHPLSPWTLSLALWIQFSTCVYFLFHFTWHIQTCSSTAHLTFRTQKDEPFALCFHISSYKQIKHQTTWQCESKESPKVRGGLRKGEESSPVTSSWVTQGRSSQWLCASSF